MFDGLHAVAGEHDIVCDPFSLEQAGLGQLCEVCVVVHKQNAFVRHGNGLRASDALTPTVRATPALLVETIETKIVGTICNYCNTLLTERMSRCFVAFVVSLRALDRRTQPQTRYPVHKKRNTHRDDPAGGTGPSRPGPCRTSP